MTQEYPITPPDELMQQWVTNAHDAGAPPGTCPNTRKIIVSAINWAWQQRGAVNEAELQEARDQELEACCKAFEDIWDQEDVATLADFLRGIRAARRPRPPSLKARGREALQNIHNAIVMETGGRELDVLKEIVESLPD